MKMEIGDSEKRFQDHIRETVFKDARFSDIVIRAFGKDYKLHRMVLCRSPYFAAMFEGPWCEGKTDSEMVIATLDFGQDKYITEKAFEAALKYLYGFTGVVSHEDDENQLLGVFAVANYLNLPELIDDCIHIVRKSI